MFKKLKFVDKIAFMFLIVFSTGIGFALGTHLIRLIKG